MNSEYIQDMTRNFIPDAYTNDTMQAVQEDLKHGVNNKTVYAAVKAVEETVLDVQLREDTVLDVQLREDTVLQDQQVQIILS